MANLDKHVENLKRFNIPLVVAINKFTSDTEEEIQIIKSHCAEIHVKVALSDGWALGGKGTTELAERVVDAANHCQSQYVPTYDANSSIKNKISAIAKDIYGAEAISYTSKAEKIIKRAIDLNISHLPICMAKTQSSLSDDSSLFGRPDHFGLTVRDMEIATGAGFLIPITGNMLRMPGLPEIPAAEQIDIDEDGTISGLS